MIFNQYYLECLSQASYLIGDETTGRAVVVDPRRDIDEYVADAERAGLRIETIIETHFHADFLSGHLELAEMTGAEIAYGAAAETEFESRKLGDGERIALGDVVLEVRATPGHTPESVSIVVYEHASDDVPYGVLTGDTLFIGDVGRPDLLSSSGVTAEQLAAQLHGSLQDKLLTLPDATRVFPAHGAGSACGKNLSTETVSTIGEQRRTNYALAPMSAEDFVHAVTEGQRKAPGYFAYDAGLNRQAHELLDEHTPPPALSFDELLAQRDRGVVVLDTRDAVEFARGHIRGAVNIPLSGRYAEWVGTILRPDAEIVLVTNTGAELEARVRLARIGFDRVVGALARVQRSFVEQPAEVAPASRLTADQLAERLRRVEVELVDVREPSELEAGAIPGATHLPLATLESRLDELDSAKPTVVYCASGYRSSIGASLLRRAGFADVSDLIGGYGSWSAIEVGRAR